MAPVDLNKTVVPAGMESAAIIFQNIQARGEQTGKINEWGEFLPYKNNGNVKADNRPGSKNCADRWGITDQFIKQIHIEQVAHITEPLKKEKYQLQAKKKKLEARIANIDAGKKKRKLLAQLKTANAKLAVLKKDITRIETPTITRANLTYEKALALFSYKVDAMDLEHLSVNTFAAMCSAMYTAPSSCVGWLRKTLGVKFNKKTMRSDVIDAETRKAADAYVKKYGDDALAQKIVKHYDLHHEKSAEKVTIQKSKDGKTVAVQDQKSHKKGWKNRGKRIREDMKSVFAPLKEKLFKKRKNEEALRAEQLTKTMVAPRDALRPMDTARIKIYADTTQPFTPPKTTPPTDTPAYALIRPYSPTRE